MLPDPRDREGLPDTIRFWKTHIEEMDADATFPVGVMYGPSGCGKSSLLKAGLLPRLASHVLPIFVEATPRDTEVRLLKMLRKHIPRLAAGASLAEALAQLREGRVTEGRKVLLVLDQFEQWLHLTAHLDSSQAVLKALLPEVGTNSKGQMQPAERLLACSGYAARPDDFRDVLRRVGRNKQPPALPKLRSLQRLRRSGTHLRDLVPAYVNNPG